MRYEVRKVPANFTSLYDHDVWEVLKVPEHGDPYLIATFHKEAFANWTLSGLRMSMEFNSCGVSV